MHFVSGPRSQKPDTGVHWKMDKKIWDLEERVGEQGGNEAQAGGGTHKDQADTSPATMMTALRMFLSAMTR